MFSYITQAAVLQNTDNCLPSDKVSHPSRLESLPSTALPHVKVTVIAIITIIILHVISTVFPTFDTVLSKIKFSF